MKKEYYRQALHSLTTEYLSKDSKSTFDLVNYAIKMARKEIFAGRELPHHFNVYNQAFQVLIKLLEEKNELEQDASDAVGESTIS